jgi:hypothetical protein
MVAVREYKKMAQFLKVGLFFIITVYLVIMGFVITTFNNDVLIPSGQSAINYTGIDRTVTSGGETVHIGLIKSIAGMPLWFNVIHLLIIIVDIVVAVTMFYPT